MFFDRHRPFYIQCKNIISVFFSSYIWDTICHYPLQYNPSTVNSATMIIASISKLSSLPCFFPSLTVVSLSQCQSHPCTGSVGSGFSLSLCAGLHNLFAKGFKAGRRCKSPSFIRAWDLQLKMCKKKIF